MEIETKIFDVKRIRKTLTKEDIKPYRVSDIVDYFFDLEDFKAHAIGVTHATKNRSGSISFRNIGIEVPDPDTLKRLEKFLLVHQKDEIKIRIRVVDSIPYVTFKGPKMAQKGIKSRDELEARIGSLSDMIFLFLSAGAKLDKSVTRIREVYHLPKFPDSELVIDIYHFVHGILEYAEIESPTAKELKRIVGEFFNLPASEFSDTGITSLHGKQEKKVINQRLKLLEESLDD